MDSTDPVLDAVSGRERAALRTVLLEATAGAGRARHDDALERAVAEAPLDLVPAAAALHRIGGTVLRGLSGVAGVPEGVLERLSMLRHQAVLRHLIFAAQLGTIGSAFDQLGVAWLAMKGPVLASHVYPDVGDRTYADLDVLVARQHFGSAMFVLESLGFEHSIHNWALADRMLAGQVEMKTPVVSVDLHWHLHYSAVDRRPYSIDPDKMIARRRSVTVSGVAAPTFDPVDTIITLGFHAARSGGHRLVWLKDIERAVAVDKPDFDELIRRCRDYRCGPPVGVVLRRARDLVGADVPVEVIRAMTSAPIRGADHFVTTLAHPVQFHERGTLTRAFTRSVRSSTMATVTAGPARGLRHLHRSLRPPRENETDDPIEKRRFIDSVSTARE